MRIRGAPTAEDMRLTLYELKCRLKEHIEYDSWIVGPILRHGVWCVGMLLLATPKRRLGFSLLAASHRSGRVRWLNGVIESQIKKYAQSENTLVSEALQQAIETSDKVAPSGLNQSPRNVFPTLAIVLRSPSATCKGVLNLSYMYVYPWLHKNFDVPKIAEKYHIVLEPSWAGFCCPEVLSFLKLDAPVFVQTVEPYDHAFLTRLDSNLVPVKIAANWWTDADLFKPELQAVRDLDFVMVASWSNFKRHFRFFKALARLKRRGVELHGACVGYPQGKSVHDIEALAKHHGVGSCIEFHDRLTPAQTAAVVRRAKVKVLWSRREGFNRAVIEALFSDTPIIMRKGFNFGDELEYINIHTGLYAAERQLPSVLSEIADRRVDYSPRKWAIGNMTPEAAVELLQAAICKAAGEPLDVSTRIDVKVNTLNTMTYRDGESMKKYESDYAWLKTCIIDR